MNESKQKIAIVAAAAASVGVDQKPKSHKALWATIELFDFVLKMMKNGYEFFN